MKIRVCDVLGYVGFENVQIPFVVEAHLVSDDMTTFFVTIEEMSKVEGWEWFEEDVWEGCDYVFFSDEVNILAE
ncbi:hypothetical protein ASO2A_032 [Escherichia phage vB_EcoM_ASO2A]|nr:hypothetical protein ASO2A_032 [Escherichia phage vB_EcoM_ASO2A]UPW38714.1 hypothetical protein ESCO37_00236 [Escherichia phage vB_EcoM_ESCO37]UPW40130.1 hypothetical protein REC_00092 [Escherichia phage vB_EcoM_REC]